MENNQPADPVNEAATKELEQGGEIDPDETICEEEEDKEEKKSEKPANPPAVGKQEVKEEEDSGTEEDESSSDEGGMYAGLSAEQKRIMKEKFAAMQAGYADAMKKQRDTKVQEVVNMFKFAVEESQVPDEALAGFILDFTSRHEMNLKAKLDENPTHFLETMREMHKDAKIQEERKAERAKRKDGDYVADGDLDDLSTSCDDGPESGLSDLNFDEGEDWVQDVLKRKRKHKEKRKKAKVTKGQKLDGTQRVGRLLLDDALKDKNAQEGWSEARKKAFKNIKTNPNAYYYRFNAPGEKQGNGGFKLSERKVFMERIKELGVNNKWGIFAMKIPGRVGYQCSNFYRDLVKKGEIRDPNYHFDGKKLHYKRNVKKPGMSQKQFEALRFFNFTILKDPTGVWKPLPARHPKAPKEAVVDGELSAKTGPDAVKAAAAAAGAAAGTSSGSGATSKRKRRARAAKRPSKKRRKNTKNDSDTDSDVDIKVKEMESDSDDEYGNPIPDFIDPINGCPVVQPAISPYGHVCGYANWTKILRTGTNKNTCPFTKKPLGRRELIKLTKANYDEYKDKIINNASLL